MTTVIKIDTEYILRLEFRLYNNNLLLSATPFFYFKQSKKIYFQWNFRILTPEFMFLLYGIMCRHVFQVKRIYIYNGIRLVLSIKNTANVYDFV